MQSDVGNEISSKIGVKLIKHELKQKIIKRMQYVEVKHSVSRLMYEGRGLRTQGNTNQSDMKSYKVLGTKCNVVLHFKWEW